MPNPPIPNGASSTEILQQAIRKTYNKLVRDWFQDVDVLEELDLNISRHAAYAACRHSAADSMLETLAKQVLFENLRGRMIPDLVGETTKSPSDLRRSKPRIVLFFQEPLDQIEDGYAPITGEIGFRLMGESIGITRSTLITYANRIKTMFLSETSQNWRKGKICCSYADWKKGYQLQLLVRDEAEGRELVQKALSIQNFSPEWEKFNVKNNSSPNTAYPIIPPSETILGELIKLPRRRPVATVRFQFARISIEGKPHPIYLCDRSGTRPNPVIDW